MKRELQTMAHITSILNEGLLVTYGENDPNIYEFLGYEYCGWTDREDKEYGATVANNCKICKGMVKLKDIVTGNVTEKCHGRSTTMDEFCLILPAFLNFIEEEEMTL